MDAAVRPAERSRTIDRETMLLGAVDLGLLAALILVGQLSHDVNPVEQPVAALEAIVPFAVGWLVIAALAGLYSRSISRSVSETVRSTAVVWIAAANVGLLLRQSLFGETAVWPFPLVITGLGLLVIVGWRIGYALFVRRSV